MKKITGTKITAIDFGRSMWGTRLFKNPRPPNLPTPEATTTLKVMTAKAAVTVNAPVGDPAPGTSPSKLHNKIKKKVFHR